MKKLLKGSVLLAIFSGIGFLSFKTWSKLKELKQKYETVIFFNGKKLEFKEEEFSGGSYAVMFGGLDIDFTAATLAEEEVTLEIYGECSGVNITVPKEWEVKLEGEAVGAGVNDSTWKTEDIEDRPILYINYYVKYSGLNVQN